MYRATAYIGTDYTPGEILPDDLDEALIKRLLKSGAIRETAPEPAAPKREKAEAPAQAEPEEPETPKEPEAPAEEAEDEYEEPEAPEVDAAEALISPAETEEKPARARKGGKGK